jgi:hypothetical protein
MNNSKSYTVILKHLVQIYWNSVQSPTFRHNNYSSCHQSTEYSILTTHTFWSPVSHYSHFLGSSLALLKLTCLLQLTMGTDSPRVVPSLYNTWLPQWNAPSYCWLLCNNSHAESSAFTEMCLLPGA